MSEENKVEVKNESNEISYDDIFVKDTDTFDIDISYYKNNNDIWIKDIDETFDTKHANIKNFTVTFRYPNFSDYKKIQQNNVKQDPNSMFDLIGLQYSRLETLFKSWTLKQPEKEMKNLNPKFLKAIIQKMNDKIGLDGVV